MNDTLKPRAWLWWDDRAAGVNAAGKYGRYKLCDMEPHDIRAFPVFDQATLDAAVAAERERCALEAEHWQTISTTPGHACGKYIAAAIRGNQT